LSCSSRLEKVESECHQGVKGNIKIIGHDRKIGCPMAVEVMMEELRTSPTLHHKGIKRRGKIKHGQRSAVKKFNSLLTDHSYIFGGGTN